jgi:hypothetical protein
LQQYELHFEFLVVYLKNTPSKSLTIAVIYPTLASQESMLVCKHDSMTLEDGNENGLYVKKNGAVVSGTCGIRDALLLGLRHDHYEIREPELEPP